MAHGTRLDSPRAFQRNANVTPERYRQIKQIFANACGLDPQSRIAYLDRACAGDVELRAEVEALLEHDQQSIPIRPVISARDMLDLDSQLRGSSAAARQSAFPTESLSQPDSIGGFRLIRKIGQGGMGVVYEAEQENPKRTVALKVIRSGVASEQVLRRFKFEAHVLGRLQHPGIAQIYEAGTAAVVAPSGLALEQPFFAMEYVRGRPLSEMIPALKWTTRQRLELFARICDAVHHAHQKGVIHRDLKPGNILVDETGQPKILDFGVARITDSDLQVTTMQTDLGQLIGTIPYMSPEQIAGDSRELDTRSDVYALGVVCYQLLAGRLPYELHGKTLPEASRAITEEDPIRLSSLNRVFRGDLESIVNKALEKDKERRYQSASDFAADVRRYLADQPIAARPVTTMYQIRKFARRNRALVVGVVAVFVVLIFGVLGTSIGLSRAVRAQKAEQEQRRIAESQRDRAMDAERLAEERRAEAESQAAIARAVDDFLRFDVLSAARPEQQGRDVTIREALDKAAANLEGKFQDAPQVKAGVHSTLGLSYQSLGWYDAALTHYQQAWSLLHSFHGDEHPDTINALHNVAVIEKLRGNFPLAEQCYLDALEAAQRLLPPHDRLQTDIQGNLARLYIDQGRMNDALKLALEFRDSRLRAYGEYDRNYIFALLLLGDVYKELGRMDEAEPVFREALEKARLRGDDDQLTTIHAASSLGQFYHEKGRYDEAEPLLEDSYTRRRRILGEEHPTTLTSMDYLALLYRQTDRLDLAETLFVEELEIKRRVLGVEHPHTQNCINNLANVYSTRKQLDKSIPLYEELLDVRRRVFGPEHPRTLTTLNNLAAAYCLQKRFADAEPLLRETLENQARVQGPDHFKTLITQNNLALLYKDLGRYEDAEKLHRATLEARNRTLGEDHPHALLSLHNLGIVCRLLGRLDEADDLLSRAWEARCRTLGETHADTMQSLGELAMTHIEAGRSAQAEPLALQYFDYCERAGDKPDELWKVVTLLVKLYTDWSRPEEAARWQARLDELPLPPQNQEPIP